MQNKIIRKLILEDGSVYSGYGFGCLEDKKVEIVFNTSMVGYQEILSDPSYTDQAVVMTYPLIGNYGMCDDDYETITPTISGMIVKEYCDYPSNFRTTKTLGQVMEEYSIAGLWGIDTRKLTRHIRNFGSMKACIAGEDADVSKVVAELKSWALPTDAVSRVSIKAVKKSDFPCEKVLRKVVAIDCGMKQNILRDLAKCGCDVTVVPWNTSADEILAMNPDGIFISNGPGDPADNEPTINTIRNLIGKRPLFGICLGHQIISLAYGAKTYKLKFGHRGGNHPVKNLENGKIEITSQNHSYAVDDKSLADTSLAITHINLLDNTVEGVECVKDKTFCVQYHPESAPGPQDSGYLFGKFIKLIDEFKEGR